MVVVTNAAVNIAGTEFYGSDWQAGHVSDDDKEGQWGDITEMLEQAAAKMTYDNGTVTVTNDAVNEAGKAIHIDEWQNPEWFDDLELQWDEVKTMLEKAAQHMEIV